MRDSSVANFPTCYRMSPKTGVFEGVSHRVSPGPESVPGVSNLGVRTSSDPTIGNRPSPELIDITATAPDENSREWIHRRDRLRLQF